MQTLTIDDAFTVSGPTRHAAEQALGRYLVEMYGLVRLAAEHGAEEACRRALDLASDIFRYPDPVGNVPEVSARPDRDRAGWSVVMPRKALVIVGRKPGGRAAGR